MKTTTQQVEGSTSIAEQITTILNGPHLEKAWKECLGAWDGSSPAQRADCRVFITHIRDNFLRILRDVDDAEEIVTVASIFYTQIKSQWILFNTQSGYQIRSGRIDRSLFCRSGMLAALLGAMEPVLRKDDLARIMRFLAEPEAGVYENSQNAADLSKLLGTLVTFEENSSDKNAPQRVIVEAKAIQDRFQTLFAQIDSNRQEWKDLQADLGVDEPSEIVPLFEKLQSRTGTPEESRPDAAISRAAQAEWTERRELQIRALRDELRDLRADAEQVRIETGTENVLALIHPLRSAKDALRTARNELIEERSVLAALRAQYGETVSADLIIGELRRLSTKLAEAQSRWEKLRTETEYLEREFGTFNPQQMVELVRSLRDKLTEHATLHARSEEDRETLKREFGTGTIEIIIAKTRELRNQLAEATGELIPLRADRHVLQNELGKTDSSEIVAHMRSLETRIQSYSDMSELLGSMEQALKTLD
ncbi:MAG: hypothetical protein H8F28_08055 [Fibrella sp.]|nr:hypothetical protein [Armatimonadota bacterium]